MRSEGYCSWSVCVCVCLSVPANLQSQAIRQPNSNTKCYVDIVLNGAFFLKLFRCKDRGLFAYHGEVRHFCLPAYNYTRVGTFYVQPYACAFMRIYVQLHVRFTRVRVYRALRVPHFTVNFGFFLRLFRPCFTSSLAIHIPPPYILYGRENQCTTSPGANGSRHYAQWLSLPSTVRASVLEPVGKNGL